MSTLYAVPGSGVAASSDSSSHGIGRRTRERDPRLPADARGGDADERERPALPVHRLQVDARLDLGHVELEDQLARLERRRRAVVRSRQPVQLGDRKLAPVGPDRRAEREQSRSRVGRMRRGAELVAEERVLAVLARLGVAAVAAVQVAGKVEAPVPAARGLQEVAADRAHVAELGRGGEPARLAESRRDLRIDLELRERRACTDRSARDPARQHAA